MDACEAVRAQPGTQHVTLEEIPAPSKLAPWALALGGEVDAAAVPTTPSNPDEIASGRVVILYDPDRPKEWDGEFRIVSYIRAELERELGHDAMLASVAWSWLTEALELNDCETTRVGGTITRVMSESFGTLAHRRTTIDLEMRASWTPVYEHPAELAHHVFAWTELLATVAGLPPLPDGVSALPGRLR